MMSSSSPSMFAQSTALSSDAYAELAVQQEALLAAHVAQIPTGTEEDKECLDFLEWAQNGKKIKVVTNPVPAGALDLPARYTCELSDISLKGGADDGIYSKNKKIWWNIPRGCTILRVTDTQTPERGVYAFWLVRANRKFTGHEDDTKVADNALYTVDNKGGETTSIVVTLKENGQAMHMTARDIVLADGLKYRVLSMGSKNVHLVVSDDTSRLERINAYKPGQQQQQQPSQEEGKQVQQKFKDGSAAGKMGRFKLAVIIAENCMQFYTPQVTEFLATNRVTICAEFVLPTSSGPINNATLHGITDKCFYVFAVVSCALKTNLAFELCLNPLYSLPKVAALGLKTVTYFSVPVTERKSIAAKIAVHPDIEGAVLYHVNELGVTKLEKSKATDYVVIRALREKIKRFLAKFRQQPSIERIVKYSKEAKAHVVFAQPKQDSPVVTFRLNEMDNWVINAVSNSAFQSYLINDKKAKYAPGPADKRFKSVWTFAQGFTEAEKNELIAKLGQALVDLCLTKLKASCKSIETRIDAIDHVPLSSEEKAVWKVRGVAFAKWVWAKFEKQELTTMEFTDTYSGQYPAFLRQFEAAQTPN